MIVPKLTKINNINDNYSYLDIFICSYTLRLILKAI